MGLKQDLINASVESAKLSGLKEEDIDTSPGSPIELQANLMTEAIVNFLTKCEFTITQLKAPVIIEELKTPPQPVDVEPQTLLGDKKPLLDSLKQIGGKIPGAGDVVGSIVDRLEGEIKKAIKPILDSGAKLKGLDLGKASGGLQSSGYTFVGEDPDSKLSFDVEGESGQRRSTTVKLFREDIERLL